ncbi:MAG: ABC transporter permease [Fimbriimonas sp.]
MKITALREFGVLLLLVLVCTVAAIREPRFLEPSSINSILLWAPLLIVVGIGQMMVIVTRGIDVSVGSMLGLSGMLVGILFRSQPGLNVGLGVLAGVGVGFLLGSLNGALITWAKVPPIIATLGTLSAFRGLIFIVSGGEQIDGNDLPVALNQWTLGGPLSVGGVTISWLLAMALALAGAAAWFLAKTRAGRDIYALGSNPEAARLRGVPVNRAQFLVYAITGALAGLAGVMYASRFGFVNPATAGQGYELTVIAAVAIGGTKITGGSGSILGVVLGCFLLGAINVALAVLGIEASWQLLVYGVVILLALLIDAATRRTLEVRQVA